MKDLTQDEWKSLYERLELARTLPFKLWRKTPENWLGRLLVYEGAPVAALIVDLQALTELCDRPGAEPVIDELDRLVEGGDWWKLPGFSLSLKHGCRLIRWPDRLPKGYHRLNEWLAVGGFGHCIPLPGFEVATGDAEWLSDERLDAMCEVRPSGVLLAWLDRQEGRKRMSTENAKRPEAETAGQ